MVKLYREENIRALFVALVEDEFDDIRQTDAMDTKTLLDNRCQKFLEYYLLPGQTLEVGCGGGFLFGSYPITHAVEPNPRRFEGAAQRAGDLVDVRQALIEALPFEDGLFDNVFMLRGFHQVRSDYEALIEVNRVLRVRGRFIVDLFSRDEYDVVCGRAYGWRNFIRMTRSFGFVHLAVLETPVEGYQDDPYQPTVYLCLEKDHNFDPRDLRLLQAVKVSDRLHRLNNYFPDGRDWRLR